MKIYQECKDCECFTCVKNCDCDICEQGDMTTYFCNQHKERDEDYDMGRKS